MKAYTFRCLALLGLLLAGGCEADEEPDPASGKAQSARSEDPDSVGQQEPPEQVDETERETEAEGAEPSGRTASLQRWPTKPDPEGEGFTLKQALEGLSGEGSLVATFETSKGELRCELFEERTPVTVANFVGLARGKRAFWDARKGAWVERRYYDGTTFHRVIPGFVIQGGDYLGNGTGTTGYQFDDETHPDLKHDRAGLLCMANRGPDTNSAQFFITDGAAPHLDGSFTIFGRCEPLPRISRIAEAGTHPPVTIEKVRIERAEQGVPRPPPN